MCVCGIGMNFIVVTLIGLFHCHEQHVQSVSPMVEWITHHGGFVNEGRIEPFESENGLGIRVKRCTECRLDPFNSVVDPLLLRVPYKLHMHPFSELHAESTRQTISRLYGANIDYNSLLTIALVLELGNESSQWRPYLDTLPITLPRFGSRMNEQDVQLLYELGNRHNFGDHIRQRIEIDHGHYNRIIRLQLDSLMNLSLGEYLFATALVNSRSFGESPRHFVSMHDRDYELDSNVAVLIPYLDLFNHQSGGTNRYSYEVINDEANLVYYATLFGTKPFGSGDEIFNSYHTDDELNVIHFMYVLQKPLH